MTITPRPELANLQATGKPPSDDFLSDLERFGAKFAERTQEILAASNKQALQLNKLPPWPIPKPSQLGSFVGKVSMAASGWFIDNDAAEHILKGRDDGLPRAVMPGIAIADYADLAEHVLEDRE